MVVVLIPGYQKRGQRTQNCFDQWLCDPWLCSQFEQWLVWSVLRTLMLHKWNFTDSQGTWYISQKKNNPGLRKTCGLCKFNIPQFCGVLWGSRRSAWLCIRVHSVSSHCEICWEEHFIHIHIMYKIAQGIQRGDSDHPSNRYHKQPNVMHMHTIEFLLPPYHGYVPFSSFKHREKLNKYI